MIADRLDIGSAGEQQTVAHPRAFSGKDSAVERQQRKSCRPADAVGIILVQITLAGAVFGNLISGGDEDHRLFHGVASFGVTVM